MNMNLKKNVGEYEAKLIKRAMRKAKGNKTAAAGILNIKRTTLIQKLKRLENEKQVNEGLSG